ncbi:MAG: GAF domain-containing protein [Chloroflexi bacterium]|nr:GAF domain-containing protein [Chloroflexota bacterium]
MPNTNLSAPVPIISPKLQTVLEQIAADVVNHMGCVGAMVATLEEGVTLVVRAFGNIGGIDERQRLPAFSHLGKLGPGVVLPLNDDNYADNLAVRGVLGEDGRIPSYLVTDRLADLYHPLLSRADADALQTQAGIVQVVVLPFLLNGEVVGSLFAAVTEVLTNRQINVLSAFGRQAAVAIQNQRRLEAIQTLEHIVLRLQARMTDEKEVLQTIVQGVVEDFGYTGAMVATLEDGRALPVRAYAVDLDPAIVAAMEQAVGIGLLGSHAVVYLDDVQYQDNLSVRAVTGLNGRPQKYLVSDQLYDLFRPLVSADLAQQAQDAMGIRQVIAVPFFQVDEVIGNLFVTTNKAQFTDWEISLLTALGQHAAAGLRNARLFQEMSEQRRIAQTFGRMAFSTVASAHSLRNHVGNISGYMQLLQLLPELDGDRREFILRELPMVVQEIGKIVNILDNLNEPWQQPTIDMVNVNDSLSRALIEIFPRTPLLRDQAKIITETKVTLHFDLTENLPLIRTAKDMLSEAFRIIIKNAVEALAGESAAPQIWLETRRAAPNLIEVTIRDNGPGIAAENLAHIFEMGWTTKKGSGMGFGLFWTRDFIEGLGGKLVVTSALGAGTTFVIKLPVTAVPYPDSPPA